MTKIIKSTTLMVGRLPEHKSRLKILLSYVIVSAEKKKRPLGVLGIPG
jgi:hypothetical protein